VETVVELMGSRQQKKAYSKGAFWIKLSMSQKLTCSPWLKPGDSIPPDKYWVCRI